MPEASAVRARARVLVVEDDATLRCLMRQALQSAGHDVQTAADGDEALGILALREADLLVSDMRMPGMSGSELMCEVRARFHGLPVLLVTAFASIDEAVVTVRGGAFHYLAKPFSMERLREAVQQALDQSRPQEAACGGSDGRGSCGLVAESPAMRRVVAVVQRAAGSSAPVLLVGESGTGKDRLAQLLHSSGPRRDAAFVAKNCAAIPESLMESEMFGHRRGAFTDAREDRTGFFEEADGGTLFLDEIGDMPFALQAKLLRVLQDGEVEPLGSGRRRRVDVRVVAATHRDPARLVTDGRFREDLYYRLNVIRIPVPPLRERLEDVPALVRHFIARHAARAEKIRVAAGALAALQAHPWPGNVRELENVVHAAVVLGHDDVLDLDDLPEGIRRMAERRCEAAAASLADVERAHVLRVLELTQGNKAVAARLLGLDRKTLYRKLASYEEE